MKHYEGELGVFDYDETQFEITTTVKPTYRRSPLGDTRLRYIGDETDGSRIVIPDGIVDLTQTFMNSDLVTPPFIPDGTVRCMETFRGSDNLTQIAELPEGVLETLGMYKGCTSLVNAGSIPSTVINCCGMFYCCFYLKTAAIFDSMPKCARISMYHYCFNLEEIYDLECTKDTQSMYNCCFNLRLSDEQITELDSVDTLALGKTFTNRTSLLKHYFVPVLLTGESKVLC